MLTFHLVTVLYWDGLDRRSVDGEGTADGAEDGTVVVYAQHMPLVKLFLVNFNNLIRFHLSITSRTWFSRWYYVVFVNIRMKCIIMNVF